MIMARSLDRPPSLHFPISLCMQGHYGRANEDGSTLRMPQKTCRRISSWSRLPLRSIIISHAPLHKISRPTESFFPQFVGPSNDAAVAHPSAVVCLFSPANDDIFARPFTPLAYTLKSKIVYKRLRELLPPPPPPGLR